MDTLMGFGFPHTAQRTFFPFLSSSFYLRLIARKVQPFFLFSFLVSLRHRSFGFEKRERNPLPMLPIDGADSMRWEIVASCGVAARVAWCLLQYYFFTSIILIE